MFKPAVIAVVVKISESPLFDFLVDLFALGFLVRILYDLFFKMVIRKQRNKQTH